MVAVNEGRERTQAPIAMAVSGLMMAHQVAGKAARDAIFLSQFSTSDLPAMVAVAAIAAVAISIAGGRMLVRLGPYRIAALSFAASAVLQSAEWLLLGYRPRIAACAIYLHIVAFGAVLLSGFWSVMNESFEPRSARRVFGRISGAGTLGGLCGGVLAERVAAKFSAAEVVLLLAMLHLACAVLLWRGFAARSSAASNVASNRASEIHEKHETRVIDAVHRYPFLLTLAGLVLAASASTALLDFVFKAQAAHTIGAHSTGQGTSLLRFFGLYYTATSLLTFLIQTFFTKFILQHAGLAACAAALPATTAVGSLVSLLVPGFRILSGVRATELMMRGSLYRAAYELFYTAVAPAEKRAVKSIIDVGADRAGDAVGAAVTSLLLVITPGRYGSILALASGVSVIASLVAVRLQRGYLHALESSLVERASELDPELVQDPATRTFFMQSIVMPRSAAATATPVEAAPAPSAAGGVSDSFVRRAAELRSGDIDRTVRAAGELGPADWALAPLLINLLAWNEAMSAARNSLEQMGPKITGMLIDSLLDPDRDFVVRRRVPRVLAFLPSMRSIDGLLEALADQRFEVRFYSARALYWLAKNHADLTIAPDRIWVAVNRELSLQRSVWNTHGLLDRRAAHETQWFFDEELQDRADLNLEHLFTLLALLLPVEAVRIAFRALHTDDRQLKGTAFEYLESATPPDTRQLLLPLLEADAESRLRAAAAAPSSAIAGQEGALQNLLENKARINQTLKLAPLRMEARQ